ncbi:MAG: hypothetical protein H7226_05680 [Salinibacterium sp.]|nr:hypothetical protein [Salinibacterium sp.]
MTVVRPGQANVSFAQPNKWFSWWWVNIGAFAALAVVAFWHGNRRPQKKKKRRGAPRKPQNA